MTPGLAVGLIKKEVMAKRLSVKEKEFILSKIAEFLNLNEIVSLFYQEFKRKVSSSTIKRYERDPKYQEKIAKYRRKYLADIESLPLAHKKIRIKEASRIVEESKKPVEITVYDKKRGKIIKIGEKKEINIVLKALKFISDEVKNHLPEKKKDTLLDLIKEEEGKRENDIK
ncbi:MAG: hypothetical protein DRG20_04945 [Deltaproteobacteria bacterium]|nr:MAG: hypothetical protein DRG20_04945 [Deltaproteobacteria bacterium]